MELSAQSKATILEWMSFNPSYRALINKLGIEGAVNLYLKYKSPTWLSFALNGMKLSIQRRKKRNNNDTQK